MEMESRKSCPFTQSTWLLTRMGIFLLLHLFPSAPTRGTVACLDMRDLSLITWRFVTSFRPPFLKVSYATHLTLPIWWRKQQNQENPMDFSFCWTKTLINYMLLIMILRVPIQEKSLSRCPSTHLRNTLHMDLDLMGWALWRKWQEQNALINFLTTRRNALFTTKRNVRPRTTWIKFWESAIAFHGLLELI